MISINPLGPLYVACYKKTKNSEHLRVNGSRERLEAYINSYVSNPKFRLEMHEPLACVHKCWTARFTVHLVPVSVGGDS